MNEQLITDAQLSGYNPRRRVSPRLANFCVSERPRNVVMLGNYCPSFEMRLRSLAVNNGTQDDLILIWHQQVGIKLNLMDLQSLIKYLFEGNIVLLLVKDRRPKIAAMQSMIQSSAFIGTLWPWHIPSSQKRLSYSETRTTSIKEA